MERLPNSHDRISSALNPDLLEIQALLDSESEILDLLDATFNDLRLSERAEYHELFQAVVDARDNALELDKATGSIKDYDDNLSLGTAWAEIRRADKALARFTVKWPKIFKERDALNIKLLDVRDKLRELGYYEKFGQRL